MLALISTIDVDTGSPVQDVVVKLGVVLLVLAVAHGATMGVLSRIRDRRREEKLTDELAGARQQPPNSPVVQPAGENGTGRPAVAPPLDREDIYHTR